MHIRQNSNKLKYVFKNCLSLSTMSILKVNSICGVKNNNVYPNSCFSFADISSKKWLDRQKNDQYVKKTKLVIIT